MSESEKWKIKQISEIVKKEKFAVVDGPFGTQLHKSEYVEHGIPLIRIQNITMNNRFTDSNLVFITREKFGNLIRSAVYPDDIILAKTGATIGKVCVFPNKIGEALIASSCAKISIDKNLAIPKFIHLFLSTNHGKSQIHKLSAGSTRKSINLSEINALKIPIPPISTQKKIVALMDEVHFLSQMSEKATLLKKRLITSIFHKMFGEPVENTKKWKNPFLSEITIRVQYGTSKKLQSVQKGIPCLRMNNLTNEGTLDTAHLKYLLDKNEISKYLLNIGDLLFNRTNSRELVGKTALYDLKSDFTFAGYLIRIVIDNKKANPCFINSLMNFPTVKQKIHGMAKGSIGQANINAKEIQKLKIIVPPINLQNQFSEVSSVVNLSIRKGIEREKKSDELYSSMLSKCFKDGIDRI